MPSHATAKFTYDTPTHVFTLEIDPNPSGPKDSRSIIRIKESQYKLMYALLTYVTIVDTYTPCVTFDRKSRKYKKNTPYNIDDLSELFTTPSGRRLQRLSPAIVASIVSGPPPPSLRGSRKGREGSVERLGVWSSIPVQELFSENYMPAAACQDVKEWREEVIGRDGGKVWVGKARDAFREWGVHGGCLPFCSEFRAIEVREVYG